MRARWLPVAFTATLLLLAGATASATSMRRLALADLVRQSDAIVVGRAIAARSAWAGSLLVTYVTVAVEQAPLVPPGGLGGAGTITVELLGGVVDGIGATVQGEASLPVGERAVLFLRAGEGSDASFRVVGMEQGKLAIVRGAGGADVVVPGAATGVTLTGGARTGVVLAPRPLDAFLADVRALLSTGPRAPAPAPVPAPVPR